MILGNVIVADIAGIGRVSLTIDGSTLRPLSLVVPTSGGSSTWQFGDWGRKLTVEKPQPPAEDRGPGGIPC